jgi:hypothetical protein
MVIRSGLDVLQLPLSGVGISNNITEMRGNKGFQIEQIGVAYLDSRSHTPRCKSMLSKSLSGDFRQRVSTNG